MPTDKLLVTLLRSLQSHSSQQDAPRLLSTAASLFATLGNPLNLTVLSAQLLSSSAIWTHPDGLRLCHRFMGVFQSAAVTIIRAEDERHRAKSEGRPHHTPGQPVIGGDLSREEWVRAVLKGADERSPRWRHLLVISGLLLGFEGQDRQGLSRSLRSTLEHAMVNATNAALSEAGVADELAAHCVTLALNYSFEHLSHMERRRINYDKLLPVLIGSAFFSHEGYRSAYFLGPIDVDIRQVSHAKFAWPETSASYRQIHDVITRPLVASMGPLSRLISHTIEHVSGAWLVQTALEDVAGYTKALNSQWRQTKLSEVDQAEEELFFDQATLDKTLPTLWRVLRTTMFAVVIVLKGVLSRVLNDANLSSNSSAPEVATTILHTLRHLFFATSRLGGASFSQYTFVHLTAIDILSAYQAATHVFVEDIRPQSTSPPLPSTANSAPVPSHPHDRSLTLFFLNTAEHLTLTLTPQANEDILLAAATPYLSITRTHPSLGTLFESAHALTLAVLSAPSSTALAARHVPFYLSALFQVFPAAISARQFRLAIRTLAHVVSPPSALALHHPALAETLLEVLRGHALAPPAALEVKRESPDDEPVAPAGALALALVDCLPAIAPDLLIDWLPLAAETIHALASGAERARARARLWECISGGEMDAERAAICAAWWGTGGGRDLVAGGGAALMSGALNPPDVAARELEQESKL